MRKLRSSAGIVSAIVVLAGASTAQATSGHKGHGFSTLVLWATETQSESLDLGDPGTTLGDRDVFTDDVSRTRGGRVIGFDGGECTSVRIDEPTYSQTRQCIVTLSLPRGQLTAQGLYTATGDELPAPFTFAITGGTGKYIGATGQVRVRLFADGTARYRLTWRRG